MEVVVMGKVVMLSTGGTIASKRNPETGLLTAGLLTGEELSEQCQLPSDIAVQVESVFQLPSIALTFESLFILKEKIEDVFKNSDVDGIVVTHGTDTLEETAYFLELVIDDARPVVVTGSQRGPDEVGTDAYRNLRQAILLAASSDAAYLGTVVVFNEQIFQAKYVTKKHASNLDGFTAFGVGVLGIIDQDDIEILQRPMEIEKYRLNNPLVNVEILKVSLGSEGVFLDYVMEKGIVGIVVEAASRGHVPPKVLERLEKLITQGVSVVITTSAEMGNVKPVYDYPGSAWSLQNIGAILAKDLDSKKARIKLAVLLAVGADVEAGFE